MTELEQKMNQAARYTRKLHGQTALNRDAIASAKEHVSAASWALSQAAFASTFVPLRLDEADSHFADAIVLLEEAVEAVDALRSAAKVAAALNAGRS